MSDPFAAASMTAPAPAVTTQAAGPDAFSVAHDLADPFLTNDDVRGSGDYVPSPSLEALQGRLCVMIPRAFDPAAKDPNDPAGQKTRELYTVDLFVLSGGKLEYAYKEKANPEQGRLQDEWKTWTVEDVSGSSPFAVKGYWVPQGGLIGRLKKVHAAGAPFLGVPVMGPTAAQRKTGVTAAQVQTDYKRWVEMGKPGNRPNFSWALEAPSPELRQVALAWWAQAKDSIQTITKENHS